MDRDEAIAFVREKAEKETTVRHLLSVEGVMRRLARHFGEDEDAWALTGLFHDLDQDQTHADAVAGLLVAAALVRPEKANGMKVSSVQKKLKDKAFAPGVNRDEVTGVDEGIGISLDEFLALGIEGLQSVAPEIGLAG